MGSSDDQVKGGRTGTPAQGVCTAGTPHHPASSHCSHPLASAQGLLSPNVHHFPRPGSGRMRKQPLRQAAVTGCQQERKQQRRLQGAPEEKSAFEPTSARFPSGSGQTQCVVARPATCVALHVSPPWCRNSPLEPQNTSLEAAVAKQGKRKREEIGQGTPAFVCFLRK